MIKGPQDLPRDPSRLELSTVSRFFSKTVKDADSTPFLGPSLILSTSFRLFGEKMLTVSGFTPKVRYCPPPLRFVLKSDTVDFRRGEGYRRGLDHLTSRWIILHRH